MTDEDVELREEIGVVFDTVNFSPELTACRLSKVFSEIYKNWDGERLSGTPGTIEDSLR